MGGGLRLIEEIEEGVMLVVWVVEEGRHDCFFVVGFSLMFVVLGEVEWRVYICCSSLTTGWFELNVLPISRAGISKLRHGGPAHDVVALSSSEPQTTSSDRRHLTSCAARPTITIVSKDGDNRGFQS